MYNEALQYLKHTKYLKDNVTTIMGGCHPTGYWEQVMQNIEVDFIIRGEAEVSFNGFMRKIWLGQESFDDIQGIVYRDEEGNVCGGNSVASVPELDQIEIPDYDAINLDEYIDRGYLYLTKEKHNAPIWVTRGCPYRCEFCAAPMLSGRIIRRHSKEYVMNWINYLADEKGIKHINIIDDNFTFHVRYAKDVCTAIIDSRANNRPVPLSFGTPNGVRMQRGDGEIWKLMKEAGWDSIVVAPESGSQHTLDLMKKDLDLSIIPDIVREMRDAKLQVIGFFIIGYPGERYEDLQKTREFILSCHFDFLVFHVFQAIPGTPIFDKLVAQGGIDSSYLPKEYNVSAIEEIKKNIESEGTEIGQGAYRSNELKNISFRRFIIVTYLLFITKYPSSAWILLKKYGLSFITIRLARLLGLKIQESASIEERRLKREA